MPCRTYAPFDPGQFFRSHHDLESKKTERSTENLAQREIRDTVAFVKACNQVKVDSGQAAKVVEDFAVDVANPCG
jgi:hypothetical protein